MSMVTQISSDLINLIAESKRRNPEIKHAAERSLNILKSFKDPQNAQDFLNNLSQSPDFIAPFLLSCSSRNAKFSSIAIQSLNKLIMTRSIPISKLDILLDAFAEATHLAVDIQLKVLQTLPTLFQMYGDFINDKLVAKSLLICSMLQSPGKIAMVINTSAATQQQIILALFDKVVAEDKANTEKEYVIPIDDDTVEVGICAFDAYRVFLDMCSLTEHHKPTFLKSNILQDSFGFELMENIFTNYTELFTTHEEFIYLVRVTVTPLLLRTFSSSKDFSSTVRVSRIILLLMRTQLSILEIEAEVILSLLTNIITKESNSLYWKRILSLEIFRGIFSDFKLVRKIFVTYDNTDGKKKIIADFLSVCSDVMNEPLAKKLLEIKDIVEIPKAEHAISIQSSSPKFAYLEQLDKNESPSVPKTYVLYLILSCTIQMSEGIGSYIIELASTEPSLFSPADDSVDRKSESPDIKDISALITGNAKNLISMGSSFIYSRLDNELFHNLIRSLQKLCHASGVMNLGAQRDSLLILISIATISNDVKKEDVRSLTISETIVETLNSTISSASNSNNVNAKISSRYINSRHIICFRVLISLTISIGPMLGVSWKSVLLTLQWFDYYLNGPSDYLRLKDIPQKPELTLNDSKSIENSLSRFYSSTGDYSSLSFGNLLKELIALSQYTLTQKWDVCDKVTNDSIVACSYNRCYFLDLLCKISQVNTSRFVKKDDQNWDVISKFLASSCTSQDISPELRSRASIVFNTCIKNLAITAFSSNSLVNDVQIENKLLFSLADTIEKMSLSFAKDQFTSAESQMLQITLDTLYELLDRFGSSLTHSWEAVLQIVNSPFKFADVTKDLSTRKHLIKSSFEILQLLLNDFLQSIPLKLILKIIDVLESFCVQNDDLNISFSAVSYYWLISDFIRDGVSQAAKVEFEANSEKDVIELVEAHEETYVQLHGLWLHLLSSLVIISKNTAPDVRNGTLQTFFKITESHGSYMIWETTYKIVITSLLDSKLEPTIDNNAGSMKSFGQTCSIILKGLVELYCRYFAKIPNEEYYSGLLQFLSRLMALENPAITLTAYESLDICVKSVDPKLTFIHDLFFEFWCAQPISYVTADTDLYQKCLVKFLDIFKSLYSCSSFSIDKISKSTAIFNSCARYPFLPRFKSDVNAPTELQEAVLECIEQIDFSGDGPKTTSVLLQLSSIVLLPLQTRSRILKKLKGLNKVEIPSFISISSRAVDILAENINSIADLKPQISDRCVTKILKGLLEVLNSEIEDKKHASQIHEGQLREKTLELFLIISEKISGSLGIEQADDNSIENGIWGLIFEASISCLPVSNKYLDEMVSLEAFKRFKDLFLLNINQSSISETQIGDFTSAVWNSSFLYEHDDLEKYLLDTYSSPEDLVNTLISSSFENLSTKPFIVFDDQIFRSYCLECLFELSTSRSDENKSASGKLSNYVLPFLKCRLVIMFKRLIWTRSLLNEGPISSVQLREFVTGLSSFCQLLHTSRKSEKNDLVLFSQLYNLIVDNYLTFSKVEEASVYLKSITLEFHRQKPSRSNYS